MVKSVKKGTRMNADSTDFRGFLKKSALICSIRENLRPISF